MPALFMVTTASDAPVAGQLTLREAITQANGAGAGDHLITFAAPLAHATITIETQLPDITGDVTINGNVAVPVAGADDGEPPPMVDNRVTVQRDPESSDELDRYRLFKLGNDAKGTFLALKLLNGAADGMGGAIYSQGVWLTVGGCDVIGNSASWSGGGIAVSSGALTIYSSKIVENDSNTEGGGIFFAGVGMELRDSLVALNSADDSGGGIFVTNNNIAPVATWVALSNVEIAMNTTKNGQGSGMWSAAATVNLTNTSIHHNTGALKGGGLFVDAGAVTCCGVGFGYNEASSDRGKGIYKVQGATLAEDPANGGGYFLFGGDDYWPEM